MYVLGINATGATVHVHNRSFEPLLTPTPGATLSVEAHASGRTLLSAAQVHAPEPRAEEAVTVMRTAQAYVDRRDVVLAYQLRASPGYAKVKTQHLSVSAHLVWPGATPPPSPPPSLSCGHPSSSSPYVGTCTGQVAEDWFAVTQDVYAELTVSYSNPSASFTESTSKVALQAQPSWWGNIASVRSNAGLVAQLPSMPVFVGDTFQIEIFLNTAGEALKTWEFTLNYDGANLDYVSTSHDALFNSPVCVDSGALLACNAVGTPSPNGVTGSDVRILVVTMRLSSGATIGTLSNVASLTASVLLTVSDDNLVDAQTETGRMLDGRGALAGNVAAQLVADGSVAVGLFAAPPMGQLPSLGPLTGQTKSHQLTVAQVMSKPAQSDQIVTSDAALSCTTTEPSSVMVVGSGCVVELGPSQTEARSSSSVSFALNGLVVAMPIGVWAPSAITVKAEDDTLNLLSASCSMPIYQRTDLTVLVDGLDATSLAHNRLAAAEWPAPPVATLAYGAASAGGGATLAGVASGTVTVTVQGNEASATTVTVSDTPVAVVALDSRLITGASWDPAPSSEVWLTSLDVAVHLSQTLKTEGATGWLHNRVTFDDGHVQDIDGDDAAGSGSVGVSVLVGDALDLTAPSTSSGGAGEASLWRATVRTGAYRQCGPLLRVDWSACGAGLLATGAGAKGHGVGATARALRKQTTNAEYPRRAKT